MSEYLDDSCSRRPRLGAIASRLGDDVLHWDRDTLATLDVAVADALAGGPRLVVIHGGPGSGRSSILGTAIEHMVAAAGEHLVHWPAGGIVKGEIPLQGLRDLGVAISPEVDG